jgi:hypothetical protein
MVGKDRSSRNVSLAPLEIKDALSALLGIPDPDATKPKAKDAGKSKRKKAPPTDEG